MQLINRSIQWWFDQVAGVTTFSHRLIFMITRWFKSSRFTLHTTGKLRRFWLVHFRKEYVQHQLLVRKGDCQHCGACCNMLFTCPMLAKQGKCFVYGFYRPRSCRVFPIDQRDLAEVSLCGGHCGYRFNREDSYKFRKIGRS